MPISCNSSGLLPPGIHDATLDDLRAEFGESTERRTRLYAKLICYKAALDRLGHPYSMIVDGSFVMAAVADPHDIDLILTLDDRAWTDEVVRDNKRLLSRNDVKFEYDIDVFPVGDRSADKKMWIAFFSQVRLEWCEAFHWPETQQKGLVRIVP